MKTPKALSVAVLIIAGIFSAPSSHAQEMREFKVAFSFNPADSAREIYSDLQRTARHACQLSGTRSLNLQKYQKACVKKVLDNGVARLARPDVAAIHNGGFTTADARG